MPREDFDETKRGNFFSIDLHTYQRLCARGKTDLAAVYLMLRCGTGGAGHRTKWSVNAAMKYARIGEKRAKQVFKELEQLGFVRTVGSRPMTYEVAPIAGPHEAIEEVLDTVAQGQEPRGMKGAIALMQAKELGLVEYRDDEVSLGSAHRVAWLPKDVVTAGGERPKLLQDLRRTNDAGVLRLLVELYALQNLALYDGVDRHWMKLVFDSQPLNRPRFEQEIIVAKFSRPKFALREGSLLDEHIGDFAWHGLKPPKGYDPDRDETWPVLRERLDALEQAGCLEWALYLVDDTEDDSSETIWPIGVLRQGKLVDTGLEAKVGAFARTAAASLLSEQQYDLDAITTKVKDLESSEPHELIAPYPRRWRKAGLVGVPRLQFPALTTNTERAREKLNEQANEAIELYSGILHVEAPSLIAPLEAWSFLQPS